MDLSFVKQKLEANANRGAGREKIDYTKIFWKPKAGKYQIRIIPNKFRKEWPLREIQMHYGFSKGPILALSNWGEEDPITDFAKKLRKSADKDDWQLANKISPKTRYFAPVVVRGEESAGVRLWEVGKLVNDQLMGIAADEDYGDFTDITDGRDFTVEAVEDVVAGRKGIKCTLRPKVKSTSISEDGEFVTKALDEQTDILSINRKYTYDQLKDVLQKWLSPEDETATEATPTVASTDDEDDFIKEINAPIQPYSLDVTPRANAADKFESLFNE
jgi:hypothetical protein